MPKFDRGQVLIGAFPAAELEDGSVEIANGDQIVVGMSGYLGTTDGPVMGTITAKRAVPKLGFGTSQDLHDAVLKHKEISFMCISGGKKYVVTGTLPSLGRSFGVTATCVENVSIHGKLTVANL